MLEHLEIPLWKARKSPAGQQQSGKRPQPLAFAMFCPYSGDAAFSANKKCLSLRPT